MLGVRRSGVTQALHSLEIEQAIKVRRGLIVVNDRRKLERVAGGCYGVPESEYERVLTRAERLDIHVHGNGGSRSAGQIRSARSDELEA
jgi:hypothetical protein